MIVLGLTGSIGMGKSTTARLFAEAGAPVYDADAAVHALYAAGGGAVEAVEALFPGVTGADGAIDRTRLAAHVVGDPDKLRRLEAVVHPLVGAHRADFFAEVAHAEVVVVDVPLLFETGGDRAVDAVVVVSAKPEIQRARALSRPGADPARFEALLARQIPDVEKRRRAHFVIDTGGSLADSRRQAEDVLRALAGA